MTADPSFKIELPPDVLAHLTQDVLLRALDDGQREVLIREALKFLTTRTDGYGRSRTPLQEAFQQAVFAIARTCAEEVLAPGTDARRQVEDAVKNAVAAALTDPNGQYGFLETIGQAIARALERVSSEEARR